MKDYLIFTDSSCDLSESELAKRKTGCVSLSYRFDGENKIFKDGEIPLHDFYDRMRKGCVVKTSSANMERFKSIFEAAVISGYDILYLGFSSGLSATYNCAVLAAKAMRDKYPSARIITVDTLCASAGVALLIDLVITRKNAGASIDEAAEYANSIKNKICHWFTVNDLEYLKRGGRISPSTVFFGNMLGIKPLLCVDDFGHLIGKGRIRGRKASIEALAQKYRENRDEEFNTVYLSHADCIQAAEYLARLIKAECNTKVKLITEIGAVIGAHSGPETLALFFIGKNR